jgi:hypothetical protein
LPSNDGRKFIEPLPSNDKGIFTEPLPSNNKGIFTEPLHSNGRGIFTEPLLSNDRETFTEPLPSNDRGIHRHTHRQKPDLISLLLFFQNKESRLKNIKNGTGLVISSRCTVAFYKTLIIAAPFYEVGNYWIKNNFKTGTKI